MLYKILFYPTRIALLFYCRKIFVNKKELLKEGGPLLIASNHPNSFLDAVIISSLFKKPVHSLARGDAFAGKFFTKILSSFNMLPVYRISEGAEKLGLNYSTFDSCKHLFKQSKIVLIFSEGRCVNEWHLRPLKKGTARLALDAWKNNIPLKVLPVGINYSSFRFYGKNVFLNFGNIISKNSFPPGDLNGKAISEFNEKLKDELNELVYEIDKGGYLKLKKYFFLKVSLIKKIILFIPAVLGFMVNVPLYFVIHLVIKNRAVDHYDSVMVSLLFLFYPLYVLAISLIAVSIFNSLYGFLALIFLPFTAWSYLQLKRQIKK